MLSNIALVNTIESFNFVANSLVRNFCIQFFLSHPSTVRLHFELSFSIIVEAIRGKIGCAQRVFQLSSHGELPPMIAFRCVSLSTINLHLRCQIFSLVSSPLAWFIIGVWWILRDHIAPSDFNNTKTEQIQMLVRSRLYTIQLCRLESYGDWKRRMKKQSNQI